MKKNPNYEMEMQLFMEFHYGILSWDPINKTWIVYGTRMRWKEFINLKLSQLPKFCISQFLIPLKIMFRIEFLIPISHFFAFIYVSIELV